MEQQSMRKGQSFSLDVVLAVVIFGFVSIVFTSVALLDRPDVEDLQGDAERVVSELDNFESCGNVLKSDSLNQTGLECLFGMNYTEMKTYLGVEGDFCIYLEDEQGRLIQLRSASGDNKTSWGSDELIVGGTPCGQPIA